MKWIVVEPSSVRGLAADCPIHTIFQPSHCDMFHPYVVVCVALRGSQQFNRFYLLHYCNSDLIFKACPLVPDAIQILVPGNKIQRVTQYTALKNDLPSTLLSYKFFILYILRFPVRSAYIFTLAFAVGWRTLVVVLLLPLSFNHYALRFR